MNPIWTRILVSGLLLLAALCGAPQAMGLAPADPQRVDDDELVEAARELDLRVDPGFKRRGRWPFGIPVVPERVEPGRPAEPHLISRQCLPDARDPNV